MIYLILGIGLVGFLGSTLAWAIRNFTKPKMRSKRSTDLLIQNLFYLAEDDSTNFTITKQHLELLSYNLHITCLFTDKNNDAYNYTKTLSLYRDGSLKLSSYKVEPGSISYVHEIDLNKKQKRIVKDMFDSLVLKYAYEVVRGLSRHTHLPFDKSEIGC